MGLIQDRNNRKTAAVLRSAFWLLPALIIGFGALFATLGDPGLAMLRYDRAGIADRELWRLVSGHFVHLGWAHYLLNAAGVALVWLLVGHCLKLRNWIIALAVVVLGIDLGFWFLDSGMQWYVGESGVLHGLLVAGLIVGWRDSPWENSLVLAVIVAKLGYEQIVGPLPGSEAAAGGPVVVNAHLYGAVAGAVFAVLDLIRVRSARAI